MKNSVNVIGFGSEFQMSNLLPDKISNKLLSDWKEFDICQAISQFPRAKQGIRFGWIQ
jgi:hypothetical protein